MFFNEIIKITNILDWIMDDDVWLDRWNNPFDLPHYHYARFSNNESWALRNVFGDVRNGNFEKKS